MNQLLFVIPRKLSWIWLVAEKELSTNLNSIILYLMVWPFLIGNNSGLSDIHWSQLASYLYEFILYNPRKFGYIKIQQNWLTYSVQMLVRGPLLIMMCLSWTDSTTPSKIFPFSGLNAIMSNFIEKITSPVVSWTTPIRSPSCALTWYLKISTIYPNSSVHYPMNNWLILFTKI